MAARRTVVRKKAARKKAARRLRVVRQRETHFRRRHKKPDTERRDAIVKRVIDNFDQAIQDRLLSEDRRLQLYAKYLGYSDADPDFPWPGASDVDIPDMRTHCFTVQDNVHNAVMSGRPAVVSEALSESDEGKTESLDALIDYQVFQEHSGETWIGDAAEHWTVEGHFTVFTPWVREKALVSVQADFPPPPPDMALSTYFTQIVRKDFPEEFGRDEEESTGFASPTDDSNREWVLAKRADQSDKWTLTFYDTRKDGVEGIEYYGQREERVFDGPAPRVVPWERVVYPPGAANLQPQSAHNPGGALWVAIVDHPTKGEIERLQKDGTYDLLSSEDLEGVFTRPSAEENRRIEDQEHTLQGTTRSAHTPTEQRDQDATRLMVFDFDDIDGDGKPEGVIYTVLVEAKKLCNATPLTQRYRVPTGGKPWRPLAEAAFLPSRGRREGMGLPELMEGLHDMMTEVLNTAINTDFLGSVITGGYKPSSNLPNDVISLAPIEMIPLQDPQRDLVFRTPGNGASAASFNFIALGQKWEESMTTQSDLQRGSVPAGKSTALRTASGIQTILEQGQARPERLLRRFFGGLVQVWQHIHWLNQMHLPPEKQIRVTGVQDAGKQPYLTVGRSDIEGVFQFNFGANASNASRGAKAELLSQQLSLALNGVLLQLGISTSDGIYRLVRDLTNANGADPDLYWNPPTPASELDPVTAEAVLSGLIQALPSTPIGTQPAEGPRAHAEKLFELIGSVPVFSTAEGETQTFEEGAGEVAKAMLTQYLQGLRPLIEAEAQAQQLQTAAQQGGGGAAPAGPAAGPAIDNSQAPLENNELVDETLPSERGGVQ